MSEIYFSLNLSAEQYLPYYQGIVKNVQVVSWEGKTLRFPANILRPFVHKDGVHGDFVLIYDANNKFKEIKRFEKHTGSSASLKV